MKKKIFIGSSSENLDAVFAIQENLEGHGFSPTPWTQGVFGLSDTTIESLIKALSDNDYAVFVLNPDDITKLRDKTVSTVRDNVIFELGLFIGALGRKSCFMVVPNNAENLHLPTDLLGITPAKYDASREDGNLVAALGTACNKIKKSIQDREDQVGELLNIDDPCSADWKVVEKRSLKEGINVQSIDSSDLFFLLLSVLDCEKSRIIIADLQAEKYPNIHIEAMYDLMGSWDLIVKFRTHENFNEFESEVIKRLIKSNMIDKEEDGVFGRRKFIDVLSQSRTVAGLLDKREDIIFYTLLSSNLDYDNYRSSRAFIFMQAKGKKNSKQRKLFLSELQKAINGKHGSAIVESVCEGKEELIVETFSSCAQSNQINHLNKAIEPVLTAHGLQKYTLACYHYDESGLSKSIKNNLGGGAA